MPISDHISPEYNNLSESGLGSEPEPRPKPERSHWIHLTGALGLSLAIHLGLGGPLLQWLETSSAPALQDDLTLSVYLTRVEQKQTTSTLPATPIGKPEPRTPITNEATHKQVKTLSQQAPPPYEQINLSPATGQELTQATETPATIEATTAQISAIAPASPSAMPNTTASSWPAPNIRPIHTPQPAYPKLALRLGLEGNVMLRVWISAKGVPSTIVVKNSSGYSSLDASAIEGVQKWRFEIRGSTIKSEGSWVNLPVSFRLE